MTGAAECIADYVEGLTAADLSPVTSAIAQRAILDTVGVALCGYFERCAAVARAAVALSPSSPASVWGAGRNRASAADAAWLNAMAGHALDFDDYSEACFSHPSVVLLPAVLALAEQVDADGPSVVAAYVAGYEAMAAIALSMGAQTYRRGFHVTGTLGTLGASVAAAKVLDLTGGQLATALNIGCSLASGLRCNVGTDAKPMHAALAAANGVRAAQLAAAGFTASPTALDGPLGLIEVMGGDVAAVTADCRRLGDYPFLAELAPAVKLYPSCGMTHSAIAAALELRAVLPAAAARADGVVVRVPPQAGWPLKYHDPRTGLEAKFSMEYVVATALIDGDITLDHFRDDAIGRPDVRDLMARVKLEASREYERVVERHEGYPMTVEISYPGEVLRREVLAAPGSVRNPATLEQVWQKFDRSTPPLHGGDDTRQLWQRLLDLPATDSVRGVLAVALADTPDQR